MSRVEENKVIHFGVWNNDNHDSMSDRELAQRAKLDAVIVLNLVATGVRDLTDAERARYRRLNELLAIGGLPLLEFDNPVTNPSNKSNIIEFPVLRYYSDLQIAYEAKLAFVSRVNRAATGFRELTDEDRSYLLRLNELLAIGGFSPLEF